MAKIEKINRTLVLEEFKNIDGISVGGKTKPPNLIIALNDGCDDMGNFDYRKVDIEGLEVKSFDEFLKRFSPDIYQAYMENENGGYFVYSTDPTQYPGSVPMKFETTAFYKAAIDLYNKRSASGSNKYDFDYSCFSQILSPSAAMKEIKAQRQKLNYAVKKAIEAKDANNSAEMNLYRKKAEAIVNEAKEKYLSNSATFLSLHIADMQVKLGIEGTDSANDSQAAISGPSAVYCLEYNSDGDMVKKKVDVTAVNGISADSSRLLESRTNSQTQKLLESKISKNETGEYQKNLIVDVYCGNHTLIDTANTEEYNKIKKRYEHAKQVYKASQDSLLKSINKIIEKIFNVKALFDNAGGEASVIIANCSASDIINDEKNLNNFRQYIVNINSNIENKIWFAVLAQIFDDDLVDKASAGICYAPTTDLADNTNDEVIIDVEFAEDGNESAADPSVNDENIWDDVDDETAQNLSLISLDCAKQMINILSEAKCTTFFGFKACETTGFGEMNKEKLDMYKKRLSSIDTTYAVFAYPNFTLMSAMQAGNIEVANNDYIDNPGLYIDAPYISAGMVIKSLNSELLKKMKFNIDLKELPKPCVRFDFEDSADSYAKRFKVITNMNCEELLKFDKSLLDALDEEPFGFFFDCCGYYEGKRVPNAFVKYSRNMSSKSENRLFATLVKDFIFLEISNGSSTINRADIDRYKSENKWSRHTECVNCPLHAGEEFGYIEENGKFQSFIHFNGCDDNFKFDDFEIIGK